jgi:hypothetical protein
VPLAASADEFTLTSLSISHVTNRSTCLDAGATRIDIEIGGGGADLMAVVDNGCGIHPDDIELAVANHATSKVASSEDLANVATLGFCGETLASLAAVSHLRLQTRPPDLPLGADMSVHGSDAKGALAWTARHSRRDSQSVLQHAGPVEVSAKRGHRIGP